MTIKFLPERARGRQREAERASEGPVACIAAKIQVIYKTTPFCRELLRNVEICNFCCVKIYSSLWAKENCIFALWANCAFYIVVWSGPNCTWPSPSHIPCGYQDLVDVTLACDDSNTPSDPGDDPTFSTFHWTFAWKNYSNISPLPSKR